MSLGCSARNQVPSAIDMELCEAGMTTWSNGTSHRASKPLHAVVLTAEACSISSSWGRLPGMIRAASTSRPTAPAATGMSQRTGDRPREGAAPDDVRAAARSASSWARDRSAIRSSSVTP